MPNDIKGAPWQLLIQFGISSRSTWTLKVVKMLKFTSLLVVLATAAVSQASVSMHNPFYCFANDPIMPQRSMFATKVAYEAVRGEGFINAGVSSEWNF